MALIQMGIGVDYISGSIGGTTFSRNRFGRYARSKSMPVNPATPLQEVIRNLMSNLTALWISILTPAQRTAWNAYGAAVAMQNRLGATIHLTGFNHYVRSNVARMQAGLDRVDTDPSIVVTATGSDDGLSIAFDDTMEWLDEDGAALLIYGGPSRSPTKLFFDGPYRLVGAILGDSGTPPTTPDAQTSVYVLTEADLVTCRFRIARADGRLSVPFRVESTIAA